MHRQKNKIQIRAALYFAVFIVAFPVKLAADFLTYMFDLGVPSATFLAMPMAVFTCIVWPPKISKEDRLVWSVVIGFFFVFFLTIVWKVSFSPYGVELNKVIINSVSVSLGLYFVALIAGLGYGKIHAAKSKLLIGTFLLLSSSVFITQFFIRDVWLKLNEDGAYLRIADLYCIVTLLIFSSIKSRPVLFIMVIVAVPILLFIGSRSSLLFFALAVAVSFLWDLPNIKIKNMATFFLFAICLISVLYALIPESFLFYSNIFSESRIGQTLQSSGYAGVDERNNLFFDGIDRISSDPFFGSWIARLYGSNNGGDYMHNILYLWDDFGLLVFSLMVVLMIVSIAKVFLSPDLKRFMPLVLFCLLSMIFARAYAFPYIFLFIGIFLAQGEMMKKRQP